MRYIYLTLLQSLLLTATNAQVHLEWAKSIGGIAQDGGSSITTDASGNVYITGVFGSTVDFDPGPGIYNMTINGSTGPFIVKLDANGSFIWAEHMGPNDDASDIAVGISGDLFVTGKIAGGTFILKLDSNGNSVWTKTIDRSTGNSINIDIHGNILIIGEYDGVVDFDPGLDTFEMASNSGSGNDIFILKLDTAGNFIWARSFGTADPDYGRSITSDHLGNVYATGDFMWTVDFDPGPDTFLMSSAGRTDVFILKLDANGAFIWAKRIGASEYDHCWGITTDILGNVYTTGRFGFTVDFDPGSAFFNLTAGGTFDAFVLKLNSSGNFIWANSINSAQSVRGYSIATDAADFIYTTGFYIGTADFDPSSNTFNLTSNGFADGYIQKLDPGGNFVWAVSLGATLDDIGKSVATDMLGNIYVTGSYQGTADFDPDTAIFNLTSDSLSDIFVLKLGQCYNTGIDVVIDCNSYTWIDGNTYTSNTNSARDTLINIAGCDSVVTLNLTLNSNTGTDFITVCDSVTWLDGITYTSSNNTATHTLTNVAGCDSVVTLNLAINNYSTTDVITACDSLTWIDSNTYTSNNNTATHTLLDQAGCDSVVTLNLTITNSNTGTDIVAACDSFLWLDGNTYTSNNNTAAHTLTNSAGCDSVVTLILTIMNSNTGIDVITACDSLTWIDGITYTNINNTVTHTLTNVAGCDSVVTLNLTIRKANTGTDVITACDSIIWVDGNTYTSNNNTATHTLTNMSGCDSVVKLNLTIRTVDASVSVADPIITANTTLGWYYQWLDCDNGYSVINGETSRIFIAPVNGDYAVEVIAWDCIDTSTCITITSLGIQEKLLFNTITILPNPNQGMVTIDLGNLKEVSIKVFSVIGQLVYNKENINTSVNQFELNEPPGVYFFKISSGGETRHFKIVKM
ncbi:MAG: SBBP repeat-containing protein [Bacteroidetes bacterium]|nr:SBBP repeat-containing protein [Bacteroidota bacterium]